MAFFKKARIETNKKNQITFLSHEPWPASDTAIPLRQSHGLLINLTLKFWPKQNHYQRNNRRYSATLRARENFSFVLLINDDDHSEKQQKQKQHKELEPKSASDVNNRPKK